MSSSTRSSSDWTWVTLGSGWRWTEVPSAPGGRSGVPSSSPWLSLELEELELEEPELELLESSLPGSFAAGAVGKGWSSLSEAGGAGFALLLGAGAGASGAAGAALRDFAGSPGNGKGSSDEGWGLAGVQGF